MTVAEIVRLEEAPAAKPKLGLGWEPLSSLLSDPDFAAMLHAQKKEMAHLPDEAMPMLFDWAGMLTQERAGNFRMWTARVSGNLAGFIVFNLHIHPFYAATPRALADAFYVAPRYRGKGILCRRMWQAALEDLGQAGIKVVIATDNEVRPMEDFFIGLGFEPTARLYMKAV